MSTSDRTINQVRAILTKLDRSIDEAREKRTHTGPGPAAQAAAPVKAPTVTPAPPAAPQAPSTPGSQYGRAQPMPKAQPSSNVLRWKS